MCAVPEIANSEEVQEFLALNTDARIAFVKKPFVVSRIDKVGGWEMGSVNLFSVHQLPFARVCIAAAAAAKRLLLCVGALSLPRKPQRVKRKGQRPSQRVCFVGSLFPRGKQGHCKS